MLPTLTPYMHRHFFQLYQLHQRSDYPVQINQHRIQDFSRHDIDGFGACLPSEEPWFILASKLTTLISVLIGGQCCATQRQPYTVLSAVRPGSCELMQEMRETHHHVIAKRQLRFGGCLDIAVSPATAWPMLLLEKHMSRLLYLYRELTQPSA